MTSECPVSFITAESIGLLEEYWVRKTVGGQVDVHSMPARLVDAWQILDAEFAGETENGKQ